MLLRIAALNKHMKETVKTSMDAGFHDRSSYRTAPAELWAAAQAERGFQNCNLQLQTVHLSPCTAQARHWYISAIRASQSRIQLKLRSICVSVAAEYIDEGRWHSFGRV